jgi:hypothetical protein
MVALIQEWIFIFLLRGVCVCLAIVVTPIYMLSGENTT